LLIANVSHHDTRALGHEALSDNKACPASRARDERDLAFEHPHDRTVALVLGVALRSCSVSGLNPRRLGIVGSDRS
jgi:hypothetical protein